MKLKTDHPFLTKIVLITGILLIATNMRAPFTGMPPLLDMIQSDLGLSTAATGALTALPLLAFAILSPFSALLAREYGLERTLFCALIAVASGIVLRSSGPVWSLYLGTGIIGMGIAIGNVLLPSLIKRDFPQHVASLTGAYALAMGIAAALGSAIVIPVAHHWGWRSALLTFLVLPFVTIFVWLSQLNDRSQPVADTATPPHGGKIWHSALAWQITLFLGLNSTIYYIAVGWLPTILVDAGISSAQAGSLHGVMQLATALPGLFLGPILRRLKDQRFVAGGACLFSAVALSGFWAAPQFAIIWSFLFGIGTGAGIILGLAFIGLRTGSARQAAALSGMAQCLGYMLASVGPVAIGSLHGIQGSWSLPLLLCVCFALVAAFTGVLAGRNRTI